MVKQWTKNTVVKEGGRIELVLPEACPGEPVEVVIRQQHADHHHAPKIARGSARGQVWMSDDFDAPLEDFKDYM